MSFVDSKMQPLLLMAVCSSDQLCITSEYKAVPFDPLQLSPVIRTQQEVQTNVENKLFMDLQFSGIA